MKKILSLLLPLAMLIALVVPVSATESAFQNEKQSTALSIDLDDFDFSKPHSYDIVNYTTDNEPVHIALSYTPAPQSRGSSTNEASPGTWESKAYLADWNISFEFDLEKSGSQWKMYNARNLSYSGLMISFSNEKLSIDRAVSTNTFPCEITGSVRANHFDNQWVQILEVTWRLTTTVTSDGTMTATWSWG